MSINNILARIDPSRYVVCQMLDYLSSLTNIKITQKETKTLFLFKAQPFIDSLYNYAHVIGKDFGPSDLVLIQSFFGDEPFRIKAPADEKILNFLLAKGFKVKDAGYLMEIKDLKDKNYQYFLPSNIQILTADSQKSLEHVRLIFAEAFNYELAGYNRKFGFLDQIILDDNDKHIKSFVLYENGEPVSTGTYYAFDKFSIENIGTMKSARGRGYASLMLQVLLQEAQRLGYDKACLVGSEMAVSIYQKIGFEILSKTNTFILNS